MSLNGEIIRKTVFQQFGVLAYIDKVIKETFDHKFLVQVIKKSI